MPAPLPEKAVIVIGAGRFGTRAIALLNQQGVWPVLAVDIKEEALSALPGDIARKVLCDGIRFLCRNMNRLHPSNIVVPALPRHLIFEWAQGLLRDTLSLNPLPVPEGIRFALPHTWTGGEGSMLVSYADFQCPDDCPEPVNYCTITGQPRGLPLYERLAGLAWQGYGVHIIRSRQMAPGLGGYTVQELLELAGRLKEGRADRWLIGTACRCHGVLSALEIAQGSAKGREGKRG